MIKNGFTQRFVGLVITFVVLIGLFVSNGGAASEKFPTRQIELVIGFSPGSTDINLRPFTDKLQEILGQPIVFTYKPGAAGSIGAAYVARAKPDGYTLFGCSVGPLISAPLTSQEGLGYTLEDFTPIVRVLTQPGVIVVKSDSPFKTIKDLIVEAKKSPGKLTYSTSGHYATDHLLTEMFQKMAGFKVTHIPAGGVAPAMVSVLGGHVTFAVGPAAPALPHLKSGGLRLLAVIGKERLPEFPDIPTLPEAGYPVITTFGWFGIVAPKNMDRQVLQAVLAACDKVMEVHGRSIGEQIKKQGGTLAYLKGDAFGKELQFLNEATKQVLEDLKKTTTK